MMQLFLMGIALVGADVSSLMIAKTSAQIETVHHEVLQERILKERCDIEIKQSWIPATCFEWLHKTTSAKRYPCIRKSSNGFSLCRCQCNA